MIGSCEYETCSGCTDSEACNFDYTSSIDNGSCVYPELYLDCLATVLMTWTKMAFVMN